MKLIFLLAAAQAGWFGDFCEKHLVMDDPYEYEGASEGWIRREIRGLQIKRAWDKATRRDLSRLEALERTLAAYQLGQRQLTE